MFKTILQLCFIITGVICKTPPDLWRASEPYPFNNEIQNQTEDDDIVRTPIVLWHGMGDTCCLPFSLGSIKTIIEENTGGNYVVSLKIGGNYVNDFKSGYFTHPDKQIDYACKAIKDDPKLAQGYNALGFSQGGQFLRAVAQRCPDPPMKTLITLGGQHQGIFGLPDCPSLSSQTCEYIRRLLTTAAYNKLVQKDFVQATYWHDPLHEETYKNKSTFLGDINLEQITNPWQVDYATNLNKLEKFVMVKFMNDTIVEPKESSWFQYYTPGQDKIIKPFKESEFYNKNVLGLKDMDLAGKLEFLETEGNHLKFTNEWFIKTIIPYLNN